jgi:hypothetical protein
MVPEAWLFWVTVLALVGVLPWRWSVVNRPVLTDDECEELSAQVVEYLFHRAREAGQSLPIPVGYWRQSNLTDSQWIYLCRWMNARGLTSTPGDWGWLAIMLANPPSGLALTQKSWSLTLNERRRPDVHIGDGNGPINIGGQQIVISGQSLSGEELRALVEALRVDAMSLFGPDSSAAQAAADSLQRVADGHLSETSPEAKGALAWVRQRASEAVGSAGGAALWAATVAAGKAFGWFS